MPAIAEIGAFRRLHALELRDVDVVLAREPDRRRRRRPSGTKRRGDGRPGQQLFEIGLALGDLRDARGQATRRAVALDRRVGQQSMRAQRAVKTVANLARQARQPRRRHLFGADFE